MSRQTIAIPNSGQAEMLTSDSVPVTTFASDINPIIEQRYLRAGAPYYSPLHTLNYQGGMYGVPYWCPGLALQTCNVTSITAPEPYLASWITHEADTLSTQGQYAFGAAPTSGIYTGNPHVEDTC